jgi:hypothetical protein
VFEDLYPVQNPKKEMSAAIANTAFWDIAGLCQTGCMAVMKAVVSGAAVAIGDEFFGLACDPNGAVNPITFAYEAAGYYSFAFAAQYPDENGTDKSLGLSHGVAAPVDSVTYRGAHDGSDNVATLADSTQSWSTDELVGSYVYNITDGSFGLITANTTTTVTATLAGGTENDWDGDDEYLIINPAAAGLVHLTSQNAGEVLFFDKDRALVDPAAFVLALW